MHRVAFPPAGVVKILHDLVEAKLFIVVRTHPRRTVNSVFFQRRINIAAIVIPRVLLALIEAERQGGVERKRFVFANEVIARCVRSTKLSVLTVDGASRSVWETCCPQPQLR